MECHLKVGDRVVCDANGCKVQGVVVAVHGEALMDVEVTHPPGLGKWASVYAGKWQLIEQTKQRCKA